MNRSRQFCPSGDRQTFPEVPARLAQHASAFPSPRLRGRSRFGAAKARPSRLYGFSVSRFHVPQGRSKIAQRFIAGLWREHKTSPVRDERTHLSSPIFSIAPLAAGALAILQSQPTVEPWATFGRPYRDFGILALPSFNMSTTRSTSACNVAAETSNHLRVGEPAATRRVALRSRIPTGFRPRAQGCAAVAPTLAAPEASPRRERRYSASAFGFGAIAS